MTSRSKPRALRKVSLLGAATRCLVLAVVEDVGDTAQPALAVPAEANRRAARRGGSLPRIKTSFTRKRPRLR